MLLFATPHTRRSRIMSSRVVPNSQCSDSCRNSATNVATLSWLLSPCVKFIPLHGYGWLRRMVRFHQRYNFTVCDFSGFFWGCQVSNQLVRRGPTHCQQHCPLSFGFGDAVHNKVKFQSLNVHVPRLLCRVEFANSAVGRHPVSLVAKYIVFMHLQILRLREN